MAIRAFCELTTEYLDVYMNLILQSLILLLPLPQMEVYKVAHSWTIYCILLPNSLTSLWVVGVVFMAVAIGATGGGGELGGQMPLVPLQ
jgi:hypothetical protein